MIHSQGNFIDNQWIKSSGHPLTSVDPSSGETLWQGNSADVNDVDTAVTAAVTAQKLWQQYSWDQRIEIIKLWQKTLENNSEKLAITIAEEVGKPLWEARMEVAAMIAKVDISITAHLDRCGYQSIERLNTITETHHKPHGVVAVFSPYNFPAHLANGHIVPALLAGNSVILKPSELTPWVAETMISLWQETNIPKGVINMLQGDSSTGQHLAKNPYINGIFFTGSWSTGKILSEQCSSRPEIILALEMGGNNPLVIGGIDDLHAAAYLTIQSAFLTTGQRCTCARRLIIIENSQTESFLHSLASTTKKIITGKYDSSPEPFMGPLISSDAADNLFEEYQFLIQKGAVPIVEMERGDQKTGFLTPGIIDVTAVKNRSDKEFFGPLLQVIRVTDFEKAIEEANNTQYGLSAGLLSISSHQYDYFFQKIRAGIINWNTPLTGASSAAPFGGVGHSGNHRPSAYYAADYCSYPVASMIKPSISLPETPSPGLTI